MTAEDVLRALDLPRECCIDRRVAKTLWPPPLKTAVGEGVEELRWLAVLKPENAGIAATTGTPELQVLQAMLRAAAKPVAVAARMQRAIPYPLVLVLEQGASLWISIGGATLADPPPAALAALALPRQNRASLATVFDGWTAFLRRLAEPARLEAEIARLRARAARAKRISERVALNLRLQQLQSELAAAESDALCLSTPSPPVSPPVGKSPGKSSC